MSAEVTVHQIAVLQVLTVALVAVVGALILADLTQPMSLAAEWVLIGIASVCTAGGVYVWRYAE